MPTSENQQNTSAAPVSGSDAEDLNLSCFCVTLNQEQLRAQLSADHIGQDLALSHPHLFSHTSVFISRHNALKIQRAVEAITRVLNGPEFSRQVLQLPFDNLSAKSQPLGVFMGYDFHLGAEGPKLIEINTNAGGAFLNALLVDVQSQCCRPRHEEYLSKARLHRLFLAMFENEWRLMRADKPLKTLVIVDVQPEQQYLFPEFKLAQQIFLQQGITALIADPSELFIENGALWVKQNGAGLEVDMVYNRLTDFGFEDPNHQVMLHAFNDNLAVITPNPVHHRRYADKRNLCVLSDEIKLQSLGVSHDDIELLLAAIPSTRLVEFAQADELWAARKHLFFKPWAGFGGRAAYRGDKLSLRVWQEIVRGQYVAQQLIPPSERGILVDDQETKLKMDIRAYVYAGEIQLLAARLYQGQTTNFRTPGGGFAPVYTMAV